MTRQGLYATVKALGLAEKIKEEFGRNFTQVGSKDLEEFIAKNDIKEIPQNNNETKECPHKMAFFKLLSILQIKRIITAEEANEIAEMI